MSKNASKLYQKNAASIYRWLEENKHKYPKGVTNSGLFSHVVIKSDGTGEYYPPNIRLDEAGYSSYHQLLGRMRNRGYLKYDRPSPTESYQWIVNEALLPPGTVEYTGVRQTIPLVETPSQPTKSSVAVTEEAPVEDKSEAAQEFLEAELKSIKVRSCWLGNGLRYQKKADIYVYDVTLWDVYKLGLALQSTIGSQYYRKEEHEQDTAEQQAQSIDSVDDTEEAEECKSSCETESPF